MYLNLAIRNKIITLILVVLVGVFAKDILLPNKVVDKVTVEAGTSTINITDFIIDEGDIGEFVTDLSSIDTSIPGLYDIEIKIGKRTFESQLEVVDTVAPTADVVSHEVWAGETLEPEEFIRDIRDVTDVSVSFLKSPDFNMPGKHEVVLVLEDTSGNKTELTSTLIINEDTQAPEIKGVEDQIVYIGEKVGYRRGVEATDNRDGKIDFEVDSSNVNLKRPGEYDVIYSATDSSGNTTTVTAKFTVKEKPKDYLSEEELYKLADDVLDKILRDDMTDKEKLWAILIWTHDHVAYTGTSDKSDWRLEAARGIKQGSGDCFTTYSTSRVLLTRAGFESIEVTRVDGTHYWNLVKYDGNWYHFDSVRHRYGSPKERFLKTDAQVEEYSKKYQEGFYEFDKSKYPRTPVEPLEP